MLVPGEERQSKKKLIEGNKNLIYYKKEIRSESYQSQTENKVMN